MPAVSKKQQKFFGMVRAVQKGEMAATTPEIAKAAVDMKKSDVKKFASTKHKGLPEKKKVEEMNNPTNNVQDKKQQSPQDKKMNQMMIKVLMKKIQALRSGSTTTISASNHLDGEVIEGYGNPNVGPALKMARLIDRTKPGTKSKRAKISQYLKRREMDGDKKKYAAIGEGSLHKWFKGSKSKDGKGGWVNVVTGGTCASDEPGEGTPKCVSSSKRASMSKSERLSAARRKKKADPGQQQKSGAAKPTYVSTDSPRRKKMKESYSDWRNDLNELKFGEKGKTFFYNDPAARRNTLKQTGKDPGMFDGAGQYMKGKAGTALKGAGKFAKAAAVPVAAGLAVSKGVDSLMKMGKKKKEVKEQNLDENRNKNAAKLRQKRNSNTSNKNTGGVPGDGYIGPKKFNIKNPIKNLGSTVQKNIDTQTKRAGDNIGNQISRKVQPAVSSGVADGIKQGASAVGKAALTGAATVGTGLAVSKGVDNLMKSRKKKVKREEYSDWRDEVEYIDEVTGKAISMGIKAGAKQIAKRGIKRTAKRAAIKVGGKAGGKAAKKAGNVASRETKKAAVETAAAVGKGASQGIKKRKEKALDKIQKNTEKLFSGEVNESQRGPKTDPTSGLKSTVKAAADTVKGVALVGGAALAAKKISDNNKKISDLEKKVNEAVAQPQKKYGKFEKAGRVVGGIGGSIGGGVAGTAAAGAAGSVVPVAGTVAGGLAGGVAGSLAGDAAGTKTGGTIGKKIDKVLSKKKVKEEVVTEADKKGKGSGTKDACYNKVKSRYSVWPSAYASGALVKCRKVGAANWGNSKKEEFEPTGISFQQFQEKCWQGKEEVQRDEYGDPIGGPKITDKQKKKNLAKNEPDKQHTTDTSEGKDYGITRGDGKPKGPMVAFGKGELAPTTPKKKKPNPYGKRAKLKMLIKGFAEKERARAGVTKEGYKGTADLSKSHPEAKKKVEDKIEKHFGTKRVPGGKMGVKEEVISERQKTNQGHRQSEEQHRSNYGKASIRNVRATGKGGNAADPAERLVAMDARHKAHKEKRGVKTKGMKEEVGVSTSAAMIKARKEAELRKKEQDAVAKKKKMRKESSDWRDELGYEGKDDSKKLQEDDMKGMSVKSGHKRPTKSGAGMTQKGVEAYRRKNPGSKLKTAVTTEPSKLKKGSKDANRRKSYCARSEGQMKKFPKAAKDPDSRLRQARKRWNC